MNGVKYPHTRAVMDIIWFSILSTKYSLRFGNNEFKLIWKCEEVIWIFVAMRGWSQLGIVSLYFFVYVWHINMWMRLIYRHVINNSWRDYVIINVTWMRILDVIWDDYIVSDVWKELDFITREQKLFFFSFCFCFVNEFWK